MEATDKKPVVLYCQPTASYYVVTYHFSVGA
jgi:hypothetical protein